MYKTSVCDKIVDEEYLVKYWLLEEENFFGVLIEFFDSEGNLKTKDTIEKATKSKNAVLNLIRLLADKDVTPISFPYVFEELLEIAENQ